MAAETSFDYYYGDESNQFSFYRIPRQLVTGKRFKRLSTDAKLLYGLLLDRMGLRRIFRHNLKNRRNRPRTRLTPRPPATPPPRLTRARSLPSRPRTR